MPFTPPPKEYCQICNSRVYPMEKLAVDGMVFHSSCFRCKKCNTVLNLATYASLNKEIYCKPHLKELFSKEGKYNFTEKDQQYQEKFKDKQPTQEVVQEEYQQQEEFQEEEQ